jgi:hypothetical protein
MHGGDDGRGGSAGWREKEQREEGGGAAAEDQLPPSGRWSNARHDARISQELAVMRVDESDCADGEGGDDTAFVRRRGSLAMCRESAAKRTRVNNGVNNGVNK